MLFKAFYSNIFLFTNETHYSHINIRMSDKTQGMKTHKQHLPSVCVYAPCPSVFWAFNMSEEMFEKVRSKKSE